MTAKKTEKKFVATKPVQKVRKVEAPPTERAVLVTTEARGVFFGYVASTTDTKTCDVISLKRARNCLYWDASVKGFMGLAATGPSAKCRIGPPASIELRKITCVADVTPIAVMAWESAPWA